MAKSFSSVAVRPIRLLIAAFICAASTTALAQVSPIGAHHTSVGGGTGHSSSVSPTGGLQASVPLELPEPRSALTVPLAVTYTGNTRVGAAGMGWDVPVWYVRRSATTARRKPSAASNEVGDDFVPERVLLSMGGGAQIMVRTSTAGLYLPFVADEYMELREDATGWTLSTAQGTDYRFTPVTAFGIADADLWVLTEVRDRVGTDKIVLRYESPESECRELDLVGLSYGFAADGIRELYEVALSYVAPPGGECLGTLDLGGTYLKRWRVLDRIEVRARNNLDASSSLRTIRSYRFTYSPDLDTGGPRLTAVDVRGDESMSSKQLPIARYDYGSITQPANASNSTDRVVFGLPRLVPRDAGAVAAGATRLAASTVDTSIGGEWEYIGPRQDVRTHHFIRDFTGDAVADLVYRQGGTWHLVRGSVTDAGFTLDTSDTTTWTAPSELHVQLTWNTFGPTPAARAVMTQTDTLVQFHDWNGDGRLDVIDARNDATLDVNHWKVWINREGPQGLPDWMPVDVDIRDLREHIVEHQLDLPAHPDSHPAPIERTRSWPRVSSFDCVRQKKIGGTIETVGPCPDRPAWSEEGQTNSVTEWAVVDVNGDAFPDVVANTTPVRYCESPPPNTWHECDDDDWGFGWEDAERECAKHHDEWLTLHTCFDYEEAVPANKLAVLLNRAGALLAVTPRSYPATERGEAALGIGGWTTGRGLFGPWEDQFDLSVSWRSAGHVNRDGVGLSFVQSDQPSDYEQFSSDQEDVCEEEPDGTYTSTQVAGLVDLNGDAVPDHVYRVGVGPGYSWRARFGTTAGFGPERVIVSESLSFAISESAGSCAGGPVETTAGLLDLDGDGKVELVRVQDNELLVAAVTTTDFIEAGTHAGRLTAIGNGYGAKTEIRYANNKAETLTSHQVPAPEVVVAEMQMVVEDGSAPDSVLTRYAYGHADRRYDPWLGRESFTGYRTHATLVGGLIVRGEDAIINGYASVVQRRAPAPPGASYTDVVLGGRVESTYRLEGTFDADPRALLAPSALNWRVRSKRTITYGVVERPVGPFDGGNLAGAECADVADNGSIAAGGLCHHAGIVHPVRTRVWAGLEDPEVGDNNVVQETVVEKVDAFGRPVEITEYGDVRTLADDRCLTIQYAEPVADSSPVTSAVAGAWITDCGWTDATTSPSGMFPGDPLRIGGRRFHYDGLPEGSVGRGRLTGRVIERYDTLSGEDLGDFLAETVQYGALGQVAQIVNQRHAGTAATRTTTFEYDEFGVSTRRVTEAASDVAEPPFVQEFHLSVWPSVPQVTIGLNGETTVVTRDSFGRPLVTRVTGAGIDHVVASIEYQDDHPAGRRLVETTYPVSADAPQRRYTHLDAIGRPLFRQIELGSDYSAATLVEGLVRYDGFGRVAYEAAPFEVGQIPFSPDDLGTNPSAWPYGVTRVYDDGGRLIRSVEAQGMRPDATLTDPAANVYVSQFGLGWDGGVALESVLGPAENDPSSTSFTARDERRTTALGWVLEEARFRGNGTRIELARYRFDRFGNEIGVDRFKNPATAAGAVTWSRRYDSNGAVLSFSEPGVSTLVHRYDEWGQRLETEWLDGGVRRITRSRYDGFGRPVSEELLNIQQGSTVEWLDWTQRFRYDTHSGSSLQPQSQLRGRLSYVEVVGVGTSYRAYDGIGRLTDDVRLLEGHGKPIGTRWVHAPGGALSELSFSTPAGQDHILYGYDSAARTRSIVHAETSAELFDAEVIDSKGRYRQVRHGNGVVEQYAYASSGREHLLSWNVSTSSGGRNHSYQARDALGRIVQEQQTWAGQTHTLTHSYDELHRLSKSRTISNVSNNNFDELFTYDPLGNLLTKRNTALSSHRRDYKYWTTGDLDRLCRYDPMSTGGSGCTFQYDGAGNVIHDSWNIQNGGTRQFSYDAASRIRSIHKPGTNAHATFNYGPGGDLARTTLVGPTGSFDIWHFGLVEERKRPDGKIQYERAVPGPHGIVATLRTASGVNETVYAHGDGRGNKFFTRGDGTVAQQVRYRAYGTTISDTGQPSAITYTDDLWNGGDDLRDLGVVILGARVYDPHVGRFLQRDPLVLTGAAAASNPYAFAFNDPVNYSDPTGRMGTFWSCITSLCIVKGLNGYDSTLDPIATMIALSLPSLILSHDSGPAGPSPATGFQSRMAALNTQFQNLMSAWRTNSGGFFESVGSAIADGAGVAGRFLEGVGSFAVDTVKGTLQSAVDAVGCLNPVQTLNCVKSAASGIKQMAIDAWDFAGDFVNDPWGAVKSRVCAAGNGDCIKGVGYWVAGTATRFLPGGAAVSGRGGKGRGGGDGGGGDFVTGYRAVSRAEADDIAQHGFRPDPSGRSMESKWFSESMEGASWFRDNMSGLDEVVEARVPRAVYERSYRHPNIDGTGPGFCIDACDLKDVTPVARHGR